MEINDSIAPGQRVRPQDALLVETDGQILTALPGAASVVRQLSPHTAVPTARSPDAEHLYSAMGSAPALDGSATLNRRGRTS